MAITRRQLISGIAKAGVPAAVAVTVGTDVLQAGEHIPVPNAAVGLLYDASICIGCKACVAACAEANDTPPDTRGDNLHQAPSDLNDLTRNVIKLYKPEDGSGVFLREAAVHALPRSGVRGGMSISGAAQRSGKRRGSAGPPKSALAAAIARSPVRITFRDSSGWDSIRA